MADFDTLESSVEASRPVEVYSFALGADTFLYTSAEDEITVGAVTYGPEAISRTAIAQGDDDSDQPLEIEVPATNVFARKYISIVPGVRATVSIFRVQRDETPSLTQALYYKGVVQSVAFPDNGHRAKIAARSIESEMSRPIPRFTYQSVCNNFLYDTGCGVNPDTYKHVGEVTDVDGNTITVSGASGFSSGYFNAGYVKPAGVQDFRLILDHTGDVLTLLLPFGENIVGASADVYAGCDHLIAGHCNTRFSNVGRHAGFAWVPSKNPFNSGIN